MKITHDVVGLIVKGTRFTGYTVPLSKSKADNAPGSISMPAADELRNDLNSQLSALQSDLDNRFPEIQVSGA